MIGTTKSMSFKKSCFFNFACTCQRLCLQLTIIVIRASVDALYRDGANVRRDAYMLKASMLRECVNMSLLRHLVKLYKAY